MDRREVFLIHLSPYQAEAFENFGHTEGEDKAVSAGDGHGGRA